MRHVNFKSDFIVKETFRNSAGEPVDLTDHNITLTYKTSVFSSFMASRIDGEYKNCVPGEKGELYIIFNSHKLAEGYLHRALDISSRHDAMPDATIDIHLPESLEIELWALESDKKGIIDSEIIKDYNKGDAFVYEDFTDEQLADLRRPATEAAERADEVTEIAREEIEKTKQATAEAKDSARYATTQGDKANAAAYNANIAANRVDESIDNANAAADNANDTGNHPTYIGEDHYVYRWNKGAQTYEKTDIYVRGDIGPDGKSAYQFAQDGGYARSELQFSQDLCSIAGKADKTYTDSQDKSLDNKITALSDKVSGNTSDILANALGIMNNADAISLLQSDLGNTNDAVAENETAIQDERQRAIDAEEALGERIDNIKHPNIAGKAGEAITVATLGTGDKEVSFKIDANDKVLEQSSSGAKATVYPVVRDNILYLYGKTVNGTPQLLGQSNLPATSGELVSVVIEKDPVEHTPGNYMVFTYRLNNTDEKVYVNLNELQTIYTPGNKAVGISDNLEISLVIDGNSDLAIGENGLTFKTDRRAITSAEVAKLSGIAAGAQVNIYATLLLLGQ